MLTKEKLTKEKLPKRGGAINVSCCNCCVEIVGNPFTIYFLFVPTCKLLGLLFWVVPGELFQDFGKEFFCQVFFP